jgi:hypothetical protein
MIGITEPLLRASHIVPMGRLYRRATPRRAMGSRSPPLWDAAFDRGLISFADDGTVLAKPQLSESARTALGLSGAARLIGLRIRTGTQTVCCDAPRTGYSGSVRKKCPGESSC